MTTMIVVGDPHIQTTNILEFNLFMERLIELIKNRNPSVCIILGDVLHTHERLHTTALNKAYEFIDKLRSYAPTYILVGNHDMCLGKDNSVLMWDGTCKMSQDIVKGDTLIGDDGSPRTVTATTRGKEEMYLVKQLNGENYTVTKNHKLSLKCGFHKSIFWNNSKNAWTVKWIDESSMKLKSKFFALQYRDENCYSQYKQRSIEDAKRYAQIFLETIPEMEIVDIAVEDYLKVPKNVRDRLYGFCSNAIMWRKKSIPLDPYIMGAWLGDGNKDGSGFASADIEIIDKWCEWASQNDAEIVHTGQYNFSVRRVGYKSNKRVSICDPSSSCYTCKACKRHKLVYKRAPALACASVDELERLLSGDPEMTEYLTTGASAGQLEAINDKEILQRHLLFRQKTLCGSSVLTDFTNPLRAAVKRCGVYNDKHIPMDYIVNDTEIRLKLLAGFIDTDGYVTPDGRNIVITQGGSNVYLIDKLAFLCRSLGFNTTVSDEKKSSKNFLCKYINISGDLERIPTILKRKRCNPVMNDGIDSRGRKCADKSRTAISVEPIGIGDYYGWTVDKNNRFLLGDCTVTHNCNNQQFLNENHWMNGMKEWENVTIVDKVTTLDLDDQLYVFCPYVPNGRFIEALDTCKERWMDASCIFAHQEFYGCAMNAITSVEGDKWKESFPDVISGHIHGKQKLQENVYYPGSAMQHAFGESSKNIIAVVTFEGEGIPYDLDEVDLKLPRKRIVHTTIEDMENYEEPESADKVKITISGVYDQFKAFKKTKKYKELIKKGTRVVFKPKKLQTEATGAPPEVEQESDFKVILSTLVNQQKDPYLYQVHEYIVNGKNISEDDVIFLS